MSIHTNQHHGPYHNSAGQTPSPYWKRAHRSWIFWIGMMVTLAAILIYVLSFDQAWRPRVQAGQPVPSGAIGK